FRWTAFAPSILLALAGSLIAGYLLARAWMQITRRITEAPSAIIPQFAGSFINWILAGKNGLSPILQDLVFALTIRRTTSAETPARIRVPSYAVWETTVFVLNVLAFMLIGMQMRPIWSNLDAEVHFEYCIFAALIVIAVILARIAWVMLYGATFRSLIASGL